MLEVVPTVNSHWCIVLLVVYQIQSKFVTSVSVWITYSEARRERLCVILFNLQRVLKW